MLFAKSIANLNFSKVAIKDIDYSEQGLQDNNYISLDIRSKFIKNYIKYKKISL